MDVERFSIKSCCGRTAIIFKTNRPLSKDDVTFLVNHGFMEHTLFSKAGILYADNSDFILTGPIGSDRLQVKCRFLDCDQKLNDLEDLLKQIG